MIFPIRVVFDDTKEVKVIRRPGDIPIGRGFVVKETRVSELFDKYDSQVAGASELQSPADPRPAA